VNYSRIVLFSVGLFLLLVAVSAISRLIVGPDKITQSTSYVFTLHIISFIFSLLVYMYLGYKQSTTLYKQAILVASIYWFLNLSVSVLLYFIFEIPIVALVFLIPVLLHVIAVLLGTLLGTQLRHKRELGVNAK